MDDLYFIKIILNLLKEKVIENNFIVSFQELYFEINPYIPPTINKKKDITNYVNRTIIILEQKNILKGEFSGNDLKFKINIDGIKVYERKFKLKKLNF